VATDGAAGRADNVLFEDQEWKIRYLVVGVGNGLNRWQMVISVSDLGQPVWNEKMFGAALTKTQVLNSPGLDTKKPVSRQQTIARRAFYG
jgi:hypothetical protein